MYEDEEVLAFNDIHPLAPVHVLVIPKKHIESMNDFDEEDCNLAGRILLVAKKIAADLNISDGGYKMLIRTGSHGGQEVPHVHLHLIGGCKLYENIRPAD